MGKEKLGCSRLGTGSWGASVFEAFENVEPVEHVVVEVGGSRDRVVFVTGRVGVFWCWVK